MGQILTNTVFLLKVSHIELNYALILFEAFLGKFTLSKKGLSQKETQKSERLLFSTSLKRRKASGKFGFGVNNCFCSKQKMGQLLTKTVFLLNMSHILLNYASLLF